MEVFWKSEKPLTSVDIVNMEIKATWVNGLVHNIIRSLLKKGMLKECGMVRYATQYARQFVPALTREEYVAKIVSGKFQKLSVPKVMVALAKEEGGEKAIIEELEEIIRKLKEEGE